MYRLTGLALTALAAGLFAAGPALAQTGSGSQSGAGSGQTDRSGSQSGSMSGQSGSRSGQSDRSGSMSGQTGQTDRSGSTSGQTGATGSEQSASTTGTQSQLASGEQKFLQKAAQGSMAEIELGKLAQERGQSEHVKQLGQNLVQDHSKALDEVRQIAQSKGVTINEGLDSKQQKTHDKLSKLSGDEFDRAFLKEVHKHHQKDISEFRKQSEKAKDSDVKDFASRTLPSLQQHQQMAAQHMGASATPRTDEDTSMGTDPSGRQRDRTGTDNPGGMSGSGRTPGTVPPGSSGSSGSSGSDPRNPR